MACLFWSIMHIQKSIKYAGVLEGERKQINKCAGVYSVAQFANAEGFLRQLVSMSRGR